MQTQNKTAVEIIQELIAVHTTRKEAADKLLQKQGTGEDKSILLSAKEQSDGVIKQLLAELSMYGDAVQADPDRENEYQHAWKNSLKEIDSIEPGQVPEVFNKLENALQEIYQQVENEKELPASLLKVLSSQKK